jgi:hypothetical protein
MTKAGVLACGGSHARVAQVPVNACKSAGNPRFYTRRLVQLVARVGRSETRESSAPDFASVNPGYAFSCPGRSAAPQGRVRPSSRAMVVRCRPGTATVSGGHSLRRPRISDAPLRCARAAPHPGHTIAADAFGVLFTFQTAHLIPAAHFCARVLRLCFTHPPNEGWAERRETFGCSAKHPLGVP